MADTHEIALMAHLMRRAGFGADRDELERRVAQGYEAVVEELVDPPADVPRADVDELFRYMPSLASGGPVTTPGAANWLFQMVNTQRPLEEKMALFWHHVFATGNSKVDNDNHLIAQIDMWRDHGTGNYRDLLIMLAQNPAMIYWLDNHENHKRAPNENWGRELLELFSLGVGHYTETDVFECARAFTGWTIGPKMPRVPNHRFFFQYEFRPGGARLRREDIPRPQRQLRRARHHRHHPRTAGLPRASSAATCTTSSSPTRPRCRPGISSRRATRRRLSTSPVCSSTPASSSNRCCVRCSTPTSSRRRCSRR